MTDSLEQWHLDLPDKLNTPILIKQDSISAEYVYEWVDDSSTVQEIFQDSLGLTFTQNLYDVFSEISKILARIHRISPTKNENVNSIKLLSRLLIALTPEEYADASGAELECLSLLQNDSELIQTLNSYLPQDKYKVMIHGDIRLDQFLCSLTNEVWIIDFEEYSFGDALKDLGGIIGSVFFDVYIKIFCDTWELTDEGANEQVINDYLLKKEKALLQEVSPLLEHFLQEYQSECGQNIDIELLSINLGAFLLERVLSRAKLSFRLSAVDKAILGIGREFIISKYKLTQILS
ncbi:Phosphotransferase enzyme family [Streptococcus agalactiae]|nr:Phosphotransferase enzyme family [Streptococcus agalactiae]